MLRLTLMTSAAIYAGLVIYSADAPVREVEAVAPPVQMAAAPDANADARDAMVFHTADGSALQLAAVIDPSDLSLTDAMQVSAVRTNVTVEPEGETVITSASVADPSPLLVAVSGSSVNLRAGPSTNDGVLGALTRGERAEVLNTLDTGWAQIRVVATGIEGFMATRFLDPLN